MNEENFFLFVGNSKMLVVSLHKGQKVVNDNRLSEKHNFHIKDNRTKISQISLQWGLFGENRFFE